MSKPPEEAKPQEERDLHAETAMKVFGKASTADVTPSERSAARTIAFDALYGGGGQQRIRDILGIRTKTKR